MAYERSILTHCREIDRCNQRGGRMLSVVDLVEAGTLSADLAATCLAAIGRGASLMVGALPGGAGKTTVMGALLNFVPSDVELIAADGPAAVRDGLQSPSPRRCFLCHEIGAGRYYAYLWGRALREYFGLAGAGHMLATNLHADTYDQARAQVCGQNEVPEDAFRRMNLMLFLSVRRDGRRRIERVWESDGERPHRLIHEAGAKGLIEPSRLVGEQDLATARRTIDKLLADGRRTIEDVRAMIVQSRSR